MPSRRRFGEIALGRGFIRAEQLREALALQEERRRTHGKAPLIGMLLVELGYMTTEQVLQVLEFAELLNSPEAERTADDPDSRRVVVEVDPGATEYDDTRRMSSDRLEEG